MDALRVRVYNVHFGDAVLVSVPERTASGGSTLRHLLLDVGKVNSDLPDDDDSVFEPALRDVQQALGGKPIDLYVMTHEHMDHVRGLRYVSRPPLNLALKARYAWLTRSAQPDYYDAFPDARQKKRLAEATLRGVERALRAAPERHLPLLRSLLEVNALGTADYVDHLRTIAPPQRTFYVDRETALSGKHPFREARLRVWAPERNTADYYGQFQPMAFGADAPGDAPVPEAPDQLPPLPPLLPPAGVDASAFYQLVDQRERGAIDNLLAIDRAANNTSIVFTLAWRGWRLLFSGDAEQRSWRTMHKFGRLQPVHFLKVSHHGSGTGLPPGGLLDAILPGDARRDPVDGRSRTAVVCTWPETYSGVPDGPSLGAIGARATLLSTASDAHRPFVDVELREDGTVDLPV
jgi:hypothetical protein